MMVSCANASTSSPLSLKTMRSCSSACANGAFMLRLSILELVREILEHARNRIRRGLAQPADRSVGHGLRQVLEERQVPARFRHQADRLLGADAAGCALPARLVGKKLHQVEKAVGLMAKPRWDL